jgi:predicted DNA-binding protein YlxM (UPF0122 family)
MINEYKPTGDIFDDDVDDAIEIYKESVMALPAAERIIFLMYCEKQSLREVAKELGVSHTIIFKEVKKIRGMIKDYVLTNYPNNNEVKRILEI